MKQSAICIAAAGCIIFAGIARAETPEELDRMLETSQTAATALDVARQQADDGHLLEALATSERVLFLDRMSKPARLLHATLLCRLDDPKGAAAEFSLIKSGDYEKNTWHAATAVCPALFAAQEP